MSKKIRGITIVLEGDTTKLGDALRDVDKQAKDISSELRQVEKLLKLDPGNVELLTQRKKLLADAVKTSAERLGTLREAQRQAEQAFREGKIGEEQYRAIKREVIAAEKTLEDLEKQLIDVNNQWKHAGEGIKNFGAGTEALGQKLTPVSAAAGAAIAGIVGLAVNAGQTADELNTLAKQTGLSTDTLQRFQFASDIIDVSLETLTGSLTKLTRSMGTAQEGNKQTEAAFKALGVTITDENGKLRDNEAVFQDVIAALGGVESETERNILAMQLMGKSAQDLNPLILGGADALKTLGDQAAASGMILDQETLDGLNEFNDVMDTTKAQLAATGAQVGATFGAILLPLIQDLAKWVQELATWFRGLDENTAKVILVVLAMTAALAPLLIIVGKVITAVGTITTAIGALKVAAAAAKMTVGAFVAAKVILLAKVLAVIAVIALLAKGVYLLIENWDKVKEFFAGLWESVKIAFGNAWEWIKDLFLRFHPLGLVITHWEAIRTFFSNLWASVQTIFSGAITAVITSVTGLWTTVQTAFSTAVTTVTGFVTGLWNSIRTIFLNGYTAVKGFVTMLWTFVQTTFSTAVARVIGFVQGLWDGIVGRFNSLVSRVRDIVSGVTDAIAAPFRRAGEIVGGITKTIGGFLNRINPFARSSPSLVDNVRAGVRAIQQEYAKLEQLQLPTLAATVTPAYAGAPAAPVVSHAAQAHQGPLFVVENMTVRSDADIEAISRQLYRHIQVATRAKGGR